MKKYLHILITALLTHSMYAQIEDVKDMKVGLVLSGGGAKGFAHIGVLKAIEEAGIEIDYIGGTSMGSIVGAFYAIGYSAAEIEEILLKMGFENYREDEITRIDMPFYQKENDDKYALKLPVINNKISLPSGFTSGQTVMNQLSKYAQHVSAINDFSKFPIPFLCIATDLEKGEQVVLTKGDLALAVRASSAFPTVIMPIEFQGKLLIDGGLFNNFPVEEVKNMGANYIIGVDVSSNELYKKEDLKSVMKITEQMVSFHMVNDAIKSKSKQTDIYINPLNESLYTTFSFEKAEEIIKFGYDTAMLQIDKLKELGAKQNRESIKKDKIEILDEFIVKGIRFTGNKNYKHAYIIEKLQIRIDKPISFDKLFAGINALWATDNFTQIQHKVVLNGNEGIVYMDFKENDTKSFIQLGVHYDELYNAGVLLNWTGKRLLFGNDFLSADLVIGENFRYNLNYFIDNGVHMSVGLQSVAQNFKFDTDFVNEISTFNPEINYKTLHYFNLTNRLNFQFVYRDNYALKFGIEHKFLNIKDENPQAINPVFEKANFLSLYTQFKYDTYDNRMFPKNGIYLDLSGSWNLYSDSNIVEFQPFAQGIASFGYALPINKSLTTHFQSEAGISFRENLNPFLDFHLGGNNDNYMNLFTPFYGYPFAVMGDHSYLKSTISVRYEFLKNNFIGLIGNVAKTDEKFLKDFDFADNIKKGFGVYYGINSMAGPIQLTYSRSNEVKKNFFSVKLGFWF